MYISHIQSHCTCGLCIVYDLTKCLACKSKSWENVVLSSFYEGKKMVLERILYLGRLIVDSWKSLVLLASHDEHVFKLAIKGKAVL
jgi:hypothetical protein